MISLPSWIHQSQLQSAALSLLVGLALLYIALLFRRLFRSRVAKRRAKRAQRGERRAAALLRRRGYRLLDAQLSKTYHPRLEGVRFPVDLRADYIVSRRGKRFVAEVKTGERAPSLGHAPTRRQLLEYSLAFDVHGVLLVDVEADRIARVEFARPPVPWWGWCLLGALLHALSPLVIPVLVAQGAALRESVRILLP